MSIRTPFGEMDSAFETMRRSMEEMMGGRGAQGAFRMERTDAGFTLVGDLPGFEREEIDLTIDGETLTLTADNERRIENEGGMATRRRSVRRTMALPEGVRADDIGASYNNGVLQIDLPVAGDREETRVQID